MRPPNERRHHRARRDRSTALLRLAFLALISCAPPVRAQSLVPGIPSPNGEVHAFAAIGNIAYVGGTFDRIGTYCGGGVAIDATTGSILPSSPGFRTIGSSPVYPGGIVTVAVSDGSGGWFVGGDFTSIGGTARPYVARFDGNGSLLPWAPPAPNGSLWSMVVVGTTLYVGGDFTTLDGTPRGRLAALDATTGALLAWNPGANGRVETLAHSGGTIYAGGWFTQLGGQPRNYLGAVDAGTGTATGWAPVINGGAAVIALDGGLAWIGGEFATVQGQARIRAAAVDLATAAVTAWAPDPNGTVRSLIPSGGFVYAGGEFTSIGGRARTYVARLNTTNGGASASWNANCDDYVYQLALSGTTLYVGGTFTQLGGQSRSKIGAVDVATADATSWAPSVDGNVWEVAPSANGVWLGGAFQRAETVGRRNLAAIDLTTRTVTSWNPDVSGPVYALETDGTTLWVGGTFTQAGGVGRHSLAAYLPPSAAPTAFDAQVNQGSALVPEIRALSLDGGVLRVGGIIDRLGVELRSYAGAVDPITGAATGWAPQPNTIVRAIEPSASGIYLAGAFQTVQGVSRPRLAQVDPVSGAPTAWTPPVFAGGFTFPGGHPVGASLFSLAEKGNVLYVGGSFLSVDGVQRANYAALDPAGELLPWNVAGYYEPNAGIGTLALDAGGPGVLAASSVPLSNGFRVLDPSSGAGAGWPPMISGARTVARAGAYILVGGSFLDAGNMPSPHLAVFFDPAAVGVPDGAGRPGTLSLSRPAPNPARLASSIRWTVARHSIVTVRLLDLKGRQVRTLVDRQEFPPGPHAVTLDAAGLLPGLYLLDAEAGGERASHKLLILR